MTEIIVGKRYAAQLAVPLKEHNFLPHWMPDNPYVDPRLAGHIDLSIFKLSEDQLVISKHLAEDIRFVNYLTIRRYNFCQTNNTQGPEYPKDVNLCACLLGNRMIHNREHTDPAITEEFRGEYIHVNQGYTKCMICAVNENAIICSDAGIAKTAHTAKIDVLQIHVGHIALDGYREGFIGGASFVHNGIVYFTGTLDQHPDKEKIETFILNRGQRFVYLTHFPIFDIGSAVVL